MKLNIREMIDGGPARLRYVFRYSTSRVAHAESVAEHSYYVALYSLFIARWVEEQNKDDEVRLGMRICLGNLLQRALLHDLEEARSGDFPRTFKHSNPQLKEMLAKASKAAFVQLIEPITGAQSPLDALETYDADSMVTDEYIVSWMDAKDGTEEGRILEFADFLSVLGFMMQENAGNGNRSIERHVADMDKYFEIFSSSDYDFIRPLVKQAAELMEEIF